MKYSIIYSSRTGNTKSLALTLKENLNEDDLVSFNEVNEVKELGDLIYIGFWTDKGNCDEDTLKFIKKLRNKKVFLFGTCGFGENEEYFVKIIKNVSKHLHKSNQVIGSFMSQGKMPLSVKERYLKLKKMTHDSPKIDMLINNFDKALDHPNDIDKLNLINKVKEVKL